MSSFGSPTQGSSRGGSVLVRCIKAGLRFDRTLTLLGLMAMSAGCGEGQPRLAATHIIGAPPEQIQYAPPRPSPADALFQFDRVPTFALTLPADSWEQLQATALDEQYTPAELAYDGQPVGTVGLRFKGNYGTLTSCIDEATHAITCPKLGMKVKFDEYDAKLRFFGLKRLNFNAYPYDQSKMHEVLAYEIFREMGLYAPRAAYANVTVNEQSYGLFGMIEQIDGRFTDERWENDGNGNLYKEAWPTSTDPQYYADKLQTNVNEDSTNDIVEFAQALHDAAGVDSAALSETLSHWMSLDYLRRFMVVDDAIFDIEGPQAFFTDAAGRVPNNHNYYFYQEERLPAFWLIPWDLENSIWLSSLQRFVPAWTSAPNDCAQTYRVYYDDTRALAPGCDPLFRAIAAAPAALGTVAQELANGPFAVDHVIDRVNAYENLIRASIEADPTLDATTKVEYFEIAVGEIRRNIPILRDRMLAIAQQRAPAPFGLDGSQVNGFESKSTLDARVSILPYANSKTSASASIVNHDSNPAVRLDFAFHDEVQAWKQWCNFQFPMAGAPVDVSRARGIKLRARASDLRDGRLEMISWAREQNHSYDYEGWTFNFTPAWAEYKFLFADATLPSYAKNSLVVAMSDVVASVIHIRIMPNCLNRKSNGFLGADANLNPIADEGYIEVDDISLFTE